MRGTKILVIAGIAGLFLALFRPVPALARNGQDDLRREKARLLEMKAREEKTAAELSDALRKEKLTKERVIELQGRLKRQRGVITGIDRRLSVLGEKQNETEKVVKELEEAHGRARSDLRQAAILAFETARAHLARPADRSGAERARYLMRGYLGADLRDLERLSRERERKEKELSGIERQVEISERKMAQAREAGQKLLSRHEAERKRLSDIEKEKREKEKELRELRRKIARMASLVARVERIAKEKERIAREKERKQRKKGGAAKGAAESPPPAGEPRQFASLAGGLSPPLSGKVITRFGKQHDPTFDVTIENRGVEVEGASGAWVKAAGAGEVAFTGAVSGYGNVLILQHGSGLFSVYGKLDDFLVKTGQDVAKGQVVGRLPESPSGKSVLYFELRAGGTAINPSSVVPLN
jgi:septal ring factor EnvC (AmiA/AmiB activator)